MSVAHARSPACGRAALLLAALRLLEPAAADRPHAFRFETQGIKPHRAGSLLAREGDLEQTEAAPSQPAATVDAPPGNATLLPSSASQSSGKAGLGAEAARTRQVAQVFIPVGAMLVGALLVLSGRRTQGLITLYFGAQPGFNLYMKLVLSDAEISRELGVRGVPAAFLVTALQQLVAFAVLLVAFAALWPTSRGYRPKAVTTGREWAVVMCFSLSFAANIGLNNLSLSFLPMSLNLIMRSCVPLVTLAVQRAISWCQLGSAPKASYQEVGLMSAGVLCAGVATLAKSESAGSVQEWEHLHFGVAVCCLSCLAAALNLVFVAALGQKMDMNPLDSAFYMSLPAALCLAPPALLTPHPVDWPGFGPMTDLQVLSYVWTLSPATLGWLALSGIFGVGYNVLQFQLVQTLSATHAAFAGNFNKAATIMLSICFGLEVLPHRPWGAVMLCAVVGNICAFAGYSALKKPINRAGATDGSACGGGSEPPRPPAAKEGSAAAEPPAGAPAALAASVAGA